MSGSLLLTREVNGIELRRGTFEVLVDSRSVGTIERGDTVETALEPGDHSLRVVVGRYSSRTDSFTGLGHLAPPGVAATGPPTGPERRGPPGGQDRSSRRTSAERSWTGAS